VARSGAARPWGEKLNLQTEGDKSNMNTYYLLIILHTCILVFLYTCILAYLFSQNEPILLWTLLSGLWSFSQNEPISPIFQSKINVTKICIPVFLHTCIPVSSKRTHFQSSRSIPASDKSLRRLSAFHVILESLSSWVLGFLGSWVLVFRKTNPFGVEP
jgi:hypothetical protein